jgi:Glycosyl transferase family 2
MKGYRADGRVEHWSERVQPAPRRAPAVSVILPAYDEATALPVVLDSLFSVLDDTSEVIVVDDGSSDDTAAVAARFPCRVLRHVVNLGKGAAVRSGLAVARGEFIIVMDADNTYPAASIPSMVELGQEHDFVRAVRVDGVTNIPLVNRIGNRAFDRVLKILCGLQGKDHLSGLYGLRREALDAIRIESDRFDLEVEIGIKARARQLRCATWPIRYGERLGEKKLRACRDGWSILGRVLSMALLYNPGLSFVIPGFLVLAFAAILTFILTFSTVTVGPITFGVHSLMTSALGVTVGFQLVVFGTVVALYGVQRGSALNSRLLLLGRRRVRLAILALGSALLIVGIGMLLLLATQWMGSGAGSFHETDRLVVADTLISWGVQAILGMLFISIFASQMPAEVSAVDARTAARERPVEINAVEVETRPQPIGFEASGGKAYGGREDARRAN